jgi:gluconate 2-dehydrogenase alpha chain
MTAPLPKTDVVIVGLGAAGGIAAHVLTKAGKKVVGLEAGPRRDAGDFLAGYDELDSWWFRNAMGAVKVNKEVPTWRPDAESPVQPPPVPASLMANGVGGSSIHYSAQSWRYREDDFTIRSSTVAKYGEEALPEGSAIADWPVTYDDLEPYYEKVEQLIGVSGVGGANPFESPRKNDYPMPPLRSTGFTELARDAMESLGYHPFPQPSAILSEDWNGRPACTYCGYCTGYGCWNDSKSSTLVSAIAEADATGNLDLRTGCRVTKILVDDDGKATGVEYIDADGATQTQLATAVIVATYVYENSRLLFLSTSDKFPKGLGNSTGQLGKYYMVHAYVSAYGIAPDQQFNRLSGTFSQGTVIDDLNGDNFDHTGLGFIRGGVVSASSGEATPIGASRTVPPGMPAWGSDYKRFLKEQSGGIFSVGTQLEILPYEFNYLDLDPEKTDELGLPVIRITMSLGDNETIAGEYLRPKLEAIAKAMGATQTWSYPTTLIPINTHAYGGTRMGDDPAASVTNKYGQLHDAANVIVLGGSNWPSTTGYNPTQTIEAHAWYASDFLAANLETIGA